MKPFDVYHWQPPGWPEPHPCVIVSHPARVANKPEVNVVMCASKRATRQAPVASDAASPEEPLTLGDGLASDAEDPSETAARNLDWQALVATLDERVLAVLHCLADEVRLQAVATRHGVCRSTVQSWRNQLTELVRSFMGADVLHLIQRTPRWRENLIAMREQLACRMDRRMA